MTISMGCKCNIGKQYEMMEFHVEIDSNDYPIINGCDPDVQLKYLQGKALLQLLLFKVAIGYLRQDTVEYQEQKKIIDSLLELSNV
jgi:hypothetical protein